MQFGLRYEMQSPEPIVLAASRSATRQTYGRRGSTPGQPPRGQCGRLCLSTGLMSASPPPWTGNER